MLLFSLGAIGRCQSRGRTKWELTKPKISPIEAAISKFEQITGYYPNTLDELTIFIHPIDGEDYGPFL